MEIPWLVLRKQKMAKDKEEPKTYEYKGEVVTDAVFATLQNEFEHVETDKFWEIEGIEELLSEKGNGPIAKRVGDIYVKFPNTVMDEHDLYNTPHIMNIEWREETDENI